MPDLIADFIDRMLTHCPDIDVARADRLAYDLRQRWGGERVYVSRNPRGVQTETGLRLGVLDPRSVSRWTRARRL
jgi:hypothetical protein